jgi:predicted  nucleic acid-binding Zn-ribbon protein
MKLSEEYFMKNLELRSSLIKSGLLLGLFIFLIYAFAVDGSGGIGGTFASLFAGITFIIGLSIAVVVSVVVMFGVYFGILYLYDPAVSAKIFAEFKENISSVSGQLCSCSSCGTSETATEIPSNELQPVQSAQDELAMQLSGIGSNVDTMQNMLAELKTSLKSTQDSIEALNEKTAAIEEELGSKATADAIDEASKSLTGEIGAVKSSVQPLNDKISALEKTVSEIDTTAGNDETNNAIEILQKNLEALKKKLAEKEAKAESDAQPVNESTDDSNHRILSYFTKKADEKKFVSLVKDSVNQDMTYAQVDEYLTSSLSKAAAKIISEHPSLTKDYIRECRQKS